MEKLFENEDFILSSTGHDYDFVGIIEAKTEKPLTFFFSEELVQLTEQDGTTYDEWEPDETKTEFLRVYGNLEEGEEEEDVADDIQYYNQSIDNVSWLRTRDDRSTGFLSDPRERGQFLALIKAYCPEKLSLIPWA